MSTPKEGPVYFWRETEDPNGFLSQWYHYSFTAPPAFGSDAKEPMTFLTMEQYMMYHKAVVFKDADIAKKIMQSANPRSQKSLGRKVSNFEAKVWDEFKEKVVEEGNFFKFTQGKEKAGDMRRKLMETGDRMLVEVR